MKLLIFGLTALLSLHISTTYASYENTFNEDELLKEVAIKTYGYDIGPVVFLDTLALKTSVKQRYSVETMTCFLPDASKMRGTAEKLITYSRSYELHTCRQVMKALLDSSIPVDLGKKGIKHIFLGNIAVPTTFDIGSGRLSFEKGSTPSGVLMTLNDLAKLPDVSNKSK